MLSPSEIAVPGFQCSPPSQVLETIRTALRFVVIGSLSSTADKLSACQRAVQDDWLRVDLSALALCTIATPAARFRLIVPIRQTTGRAGRI